MTPETKAMNEAAEKQAFKKGNAHTLRTEPAWHYSLIDFKAGWEACASYRDEMAAKGFDETNIYIDPIFEKYMDKPLTEQISMHNGDFLTIVGAMLRRTAKAQHSIMHSREQKLVEAILAAKEAVYACHGCYEESGEYEEGFVSTRDKAKQAISQTLAELGIEG